MFDLNYYNPVTISLSPPHTSHTVLTHKEPPADTKEHNHQEKGNMSASFKKIVSMLRSLDLVSKS